MSFTNERSRESPAQVRHFSKQHAKQQIRAGKWRNRQQHSPELDMLRKLMKGTKLKLSSTEHELFDAMKNVPQTTGSRISKKKVDATKKELATAKLVVEARVKEILQDWKYDGYGHIDQAKGNGSVQVYLKIFNSLSIEKRGGKHWKFGAVDVMRKSTPT